MSDFHDRYQRLAKGPLGLSSLWLGEGHLVYVKGSGFFMPFVEEYKRFRLSEIQAFSLAKTSRFGAGLFLEILALGVCGGVAALVLLLSDSPGPVALGFVSLGFLGALLSAALILRSLVLGPTCVCDLQTRLTRERIRPLRRYHRSLETVRRIEGLIRESQSALVAPDAAEEGKARLVRLPAAAAAEFFSVPAVVLAAFGAFLVLGLSGLAGLHLESLALTGGVLLLLLGASLLLVIALIAAVRRPTPDAIRASLWTLLGLDFLVTGIGSVYFLVVAAGEPAYTVGLTGPLEAFAAVAAEGGMILYGVFAGLFLGFLAASAAGLGLGAKWRGRISRAKSLAAAPAPDGGGGDGDRT